MRELNEEEIIDIVKEIKSHQVAFYEPKEHKQILKNYFTKEQSDAIQGLLDLYQAEKEKNKELENADLTTVYMNGFYDGEKKWKDKIKAKIEELEKETKNTYIRGEKILVLQELLEERN